MGIFDIFDGVSDPVEAPRNTDKYSRWRRILKKTSSGRTMFVCLICGNCSDRPAQKCQSEPSKITHNNLDDSRRPATNQLPPCDVVEYRINKSIREHVKYGPMRLDMILTERTCQDCHGWGCGTCHGTGDVIFSAVVEGLPLV